MPSREGFTEMRAVFLYSEELDRKEQGLLRARKDGLISLYEFGR